MSITNPKVDFQPGNAYESLGTVFSTFFGIVYLTRDFNTPTGVFIIDLDGDKDLDVLASSRSDNKIAWFENTGNFFGIAVYYAF